MKQTIEIDIDEAAIEAYKAQLHEMLAELKAPHPEMMDRFATEALFLAIHLSRLRATDDRYEVETIATCQMLEDLGGVAMEVMLAVNELMVEVRNRLLVASEPSQMHA